MAWSIQVFAKELDAIFKGQKKIYSAQYVDAFHPKVIIDYEGEIGIATKKAILALFPDFVYIDFHPGTVFGSGTRTGIVGG